MPETRDYFIVARILVEDVTEEDAVALATRLSESTDDEYETMINEDTSLIWTVEKAAVEADA